jgi:hypothetical protein
MNGEFDIVAVDQGYLLRPTEYDPTFLENTKVIWSIEKTDEISKLTEANVTKQPFVVYIAGVDNRRVPVRTATMSTCWSVVDPIKPFMTMVPRDAYVQLMDVRHGRRWIN